MNQSDPREIYLELRQQALSVAAETVGVSIAPNSHTPWCVLMETGYDEGSASLVAILDGSASLYFSGGGGLIGGGHHQAIREAAIAMVTLAAQFQPQMVVTKSFPLPTRGQTIFYVRANGGIFTASAVEEDLGEDRHPLSPLFYAGHEIIWRYRQIDENQQASP